MSRSHIRAVCAAACAVALWLACAVPASAAPMYGVQVWPEGDPDRPDTVLLIASVFLDPTAKLPATVRLPVPAGAVISWAGEITGGPAEEDIPRPYEVTATPLGDVLVMTIETTGNAQYDAWWMPLTRDGERAVAEAQWVQSVPADAVGFTIRMPPGAGEVRIDPEPQGAPAQNAVGERLYTLPTLSMQPGDEAVVALSFIPGGASSQPRAGDGGSPLPYVVGVFAVLLIALAAVMVVERRKRSGADAPEE